MMDSQCVYDEQQGAVHVALPIAVIAQVLIATLPGWYKPNNDLDSSLDVTCT